MSRFILAVALAVSCGSSVRADDSDWTLVFQDDFKRAELGDGWIPEKGMSIVDGTLRLRGTVAARINRHFKPDIRVEYDAQVPDDIPPCDVSATLCGGPDIGWGYLLAFGGAWNHETHLMGPCKWFFDRKPPLLIEHGKRYHCVALKEGKRIAYIVNGIALIDQALDDPIGGPGFDVAALLTWTGMDVFSVKAYERIAPAPDTPPTVEKIPEGPLVRDGRKLVVREGASTPAIASAVAAFNAGDLPGALQQFQAMGGTLSGLLGQAYVLGDLAYVERYKHPEFRKLADDFAAAATAAPGDKALADFARMAAWFARFNMRRRAESTVSAIRLRALGPDGNPFYPKARFYQARYHYWDGAEGGNQKMKQEAVDWMAELRKIWPENSVLRQYAGETIPWGGQFTADTARHPAWAAYLREAYARDIAFMHHFIAERQDDQGGFGGGYGDDCEMMRTWMQIAAVSSAAEQARQGIQNLAGGIWDHELKDDGYDDTLSDVEHSAEPSADMLPGMLFLRYGDPLWVERNLRTCKTLKEMYMGVNALGYPQFKASVFGGGKIEPTVMGGGDSGYCARAMKHVLWEAWRGNPEARDWFVRWADGWRHLTMSEVDGKIAGVIPFNVWWPNGSITPPVKGATWWDPKLNYCPGGGMIADAFLAAYALSRDPKFLKPLQLGMSMGMNGPVARPPHPEGSREWQIDQMIGFNGNMPLEQCKTAVYFWLTGDPAYCDFAKAYGDPTHVYRIDWDLDKYMQAFKAAAMGLRNNLDLQTTEVLSTDRCGLGSALTIFGAYTGAVSGMRDAATPSFSVTYDTPTTDFAALVTFCSNERLNVWLYNFDDKPMPTGLKLWRLRPGTYALLQGEQVGGENSKIKRYIWQPPQTVTILHRAEGPTITVPPGKVWGVDLRLEEPIDVPETAPDLAIGRADIARAGTGVSVTVHNIGSADAKPFTVALQRKVDGVWTTVEERKIASLAAPRDFAPSRTTLTFKPVDGPARIAIDPSGQYELCVANDAFEF